MSQALVTTKNTLVSAVVVIASVLGFPMASANAEMDIAALTGKISGQVDNVETIGLAILGVLVVIAGIALLRRIVH